MIATCGIAVALLDFFDTTAREVADGAVGALAEGDVAAYRSLHCPFVQDGPLAAVPPVSSKATLTVELLGFKQFRGEEGDHAKATVAVREMNAEFALLILDLEGSWCVVNAYLCGQGTGDSHSFVATVECSDRPYWGSS
ncbi:hypothetical protein GCM10010470_22000 [Saccharopolyspora taberi]|uniref:Uncharacterized protein n=1 Tax=Saccharopolyspora taberi TaxID=60895 RepID=A0ABN3VAN4_9PSEU